MAQDWKTDVPASGPLPADMEALEARVRWKMEVGEPLTAEERAFFARMPADKGLTPLGARTASPDEGETKR